MWMVRPMGGLGSHMVGLTQLRVLEITYSLLSSVSLPLVVVNRDSFTLG